MGVSFPRLTNTETVSLPTLPHDLGCPRKEEEEAKILRPETRKEEGDGEGRGRVIRGGRDEVLGTERSVSPV